MTIERQKTGLETVTMYHGTTRERASSIMRNGVDVNADRSRDPGDFGFGFYLTRDIDRAQRHGEAVIAVEVDVANMVRIEDPYFGGIDIEETRDDDGRKLKTFCGRKKPATSFAEEVFCALAFDCDGTMLTCSGTLTHEHKAQSAKVIQRAFLTMGFDGIWSGLDDEETVIFNPRCVVAMQLSPVVPLGKRKKMTIKIIDFVDVDLTSDSGMNALRDNSPDIHRWLMQHPNNVLVHSRSSTRLHLASANDDSTLDHGVCSIDGTGGIYVAEQPLPHIEAFCGVARCRTKVWLCKGIEYSVCPKCLKEADTKHRAKTGEDQ